MKIILSGKALKDLKHIDKTISKQIIEKLENDLLNKFYTGKIKKIKAVREIIFRFRVGDYRISFVAQIDYLKVISIKHRKDVYKKL